MNKRPRHQNKKRDYKSSDKDSYKRPNKNYRPNGESSQNVRQYKSLSDDLKLEGKSTLCSFVILENHDSRLTLKILDDIVKSETMNNIVVSIHEKSFESVKSAISEHFKGRQDIFIFHQYCCCNINNIHNKAFKTRESDIFFVTHSGMEPRPHSLNILKSYLYKENTIAVAPTVYTESGQIQKYSVRIPTLCDQIKVMLGSRTTAQKLMMMERGESGYYKIHKVIGTFAPFAVNSKVFKRSGMFTLTRDEKSSRFTFFKKANKLGTVLFVPSARMIEHQSPEPNVCLLSKICYFITNVF